jgi:diguanylate cyclase (GGDEF)-like protein
MTKVFISTKANSRLPEDTYIELVRDLFGTLLPTIIMAVSFAVVGALVVTEHRSATLLVLTGLGVTAALGRISILLYFRKDARNPALTGSRARHMESCYKLAYLSFSVFLGLFCAVAYSEADASLESVITALVFGYGAGVAAGLSVRPRIGIPSVAIATVPTILATIHQSSLPSLVLGFLLTAFLAGGIYAINSRYQAVSTRLTTIGSFASLARRDHLTGLGNRLAFREAFDAYALAPGRSGVAVHCLDLDSFKPVNDRFGHAIGDALLIAVAARLRNLLRDCDFAARLGGDEFAVIQTQVRYPTEVDLLARRIVREIAEPYVIEGHEIVVGTSIGYVFASEKGNLDNLTMCADQALYRAKRQGGGVACYNPSPTDGRYLQQSAQYRR